MNDDSKKTNFKQDRDLFRMELTNIFDHKHAR